MDATEKTTVREFISATTTFPAAIHAWEIHLADQGRSLYTIKAFRSDIQLLASWLSPDRTISSVTTENLDRFLIWMNQERKVPCSPKTLSRRITSIKCFFKWLTTYGVLDEDPAEKVLQKSVISPLPEILTMEEYKLVLEMANSYLTAKKPDARPMTLLQLILSTGIKKGETVSLCMNHIEADDPENIIAHIRYGNPENRYKERSIELPINWLSVYQEYIKQYRITDQIFPWSPRRLEYILEDIGEDAGLTKHLSFAMCRWTCAVHDLSTNAEPEMIRAKLGVSKIQWREIGNKLESLRPIYLGKHEN